MQFGAKEPGDVGVNPRLNRTIRSSAIGECGNHTHREAEAVGIEHRAIHLNPTNLEQFRGQVSVRTRPKNTNKTRYRTFL